MSSTLEYRAVSKSYQKGEAPAVDAVSLKVKKGELLTLVGESGSGKTTLLRLAAGLEAPDAGEVLIGDEVVAGPNQWFPPEKREIGLVFQDGALFPHLSVAENICYGLKGRTKPKQARTVDFMLAMVGLSGFGKRFPHELSGGERQRLAVARALAPQPRVVLLDEPFSNLDPSLRRSLRDEIRRILNKVNATAIMVTHDTDDALAIGDRITIFRNGQIEQISTPDKIYHEPKNGYCAQLFGPANRIDVEGNAEPSWVRPEDMKLLASKADGAYAAKVDSVRDAGRHREIMAHPLKASDHPMNPNRWMIYSSRDSNVKPGDKVWIRCS